MNQKGVTFSGEMAIKSIALMHERSNGLGGGFAAYGIYPEYADYYAFHCIFGDEKARNETEEYLKLYFSIRDSEPIPTRRVKNVTCPPLLWRYFLRAKHDCLNSSGLSEVDFVISAVMHINAKFDNAFVASSGKNMGVFKGVGYPEDIGDFYKLDEYKGYTWTVHGRFPTNSAGWWGGAHPFGLLDWTVVHNGEVSSYGINKRYLKNFGYECNLFTDTEVLAYLFDLLSRRHGLSFEIIAKILSAPIWEEIERMPEPEKKVYEALRITYSSALVNGPFSVIVANEKYMVGLNDRIKLRPLVAASKGDFLFVSSEESAILEVCPDPERVWMPRAGEPVIGQLRENK
ncbi:MAG: glutamine amidotransferase family protein [bacterium]